MPLPPDLDEQHVFWALHYMNHIYLLAQQTNPTQTCLTNLLVDFILVFEDVCSRSCAVSLRSVGRCYSCCHTVCGRVGKKTAEKLKWYFKLTNL